MELDDFLKNIEIVPTDGDNFLSAITRLSNLSSVDDKGISYHVNKIFLVNNMGVLQVDNMGNKYFEFDFGREGDIISDIELRSSFCSCKLNINSNFHETNKRVVLCSSIFSVVKLIIMIEDDRNIDSPIYLSYKVTVLNNYTLMKIRNTNTILCDGIEYTNGIAI